MQHAFVITGQSIHWRACIIYLALVSAALIAVDRKGSFCYHKVFTFHMSPLEYVRVFLFHKVYILTPWNFG